MQILAIAGLVGGAGLSAYSTIQEGKSAAREGKIEQQKYYAEAESTRQAGEYELLEMQRQAERRTSSQVADIIANGGMITGSNLKLVADSAYEAAMDRIVTGRNYANQASKLTQAGDLARYQGQLARRNARMRAFSDILGTAGMGYLMYKQPKPSAKTVPAVGGMSKGTYMYKG